MKKMLQVINTVFVFIGAVITAVFVVLFISDKDRYEQKEIIDDREEINAKAAQKRQEALLRIASSDARSLSESYGTVCDTICDGKERFRRRCSKADN